MKNTIAALVLVWAPALLCAESPSAIAIRDARVVTVSGPTLERATVIVRDGLIEAVGESVAIPADAWVIDGKGLTVYPGLIDALSSIGLVETQSAAPGPGRGVGASRGPEDRPSTTSWLRAADLLSASDRRIEEARSAGFTTSAVFPTSGLFAGQGAIVNLAGERKRMVLAAPAGQYLSFTVRGPAGSGESGAGGGRAFPNSLMGAIAYARQLFLDSAHYKLAREAYERHMPGVARPDYDRAVEGLLESPRFLLPARSAVELIRVANFVAELKLPAIIYGGHEAYRVSEQVAKSGIPVLVSLRWPERARDSDPDENESLRTLELRARAPSSAAELSKAGARFAFYSDGTAPRDVARAVKRAIDSGLPQAAALRAMTLGAAEIYGVADRLGSIDQGKIANLVIAEGDLFQERSKIKFVIVDGSKFEPLPEAPPSERQPGGLP